MIDATRDHKVGQTTFNVKTQYDNLSSVGKGSYGVVVSSVNKITNEKIAIKKVASTLTDVEDAKHALREVRLMRYLSAHEYIMNIRDLSLNQNHGDLYIYMELLDSDLHRVIQSKQALSDDHVRYFMYQILRAVRFMHEHDIIHRDLKPGNILVNKNCDIRISDFGMARQRPRNLTAKNTTKNKSMAMTQHVITRWYRPPELMLHPDGLYTDAVDMWSVGCIFAELASRTPLFQGKNFLHQLTLIFDVLGSPKEEEIAHITSRQARNFLNKMAGKKKRPFSEVLKNKENINPQVIELIDQMLQFDPEKRLSAREALEHEYFDPLRSLEKTCPDPANMSGAIDFSFENGGNESNPSLSCDLRGLRELIDLEVAVFEEGNNGYDVAPSTYERLPKGTRNPAAASSSKYDNKATMGQRKRNHCRGALCSGYGGEIADANIGQRTEDNVSKTRKTSQHDANNDCDEKIIGSDVRCHRTEYGASQCVSPITDDDSDKENKNLCARPKCTYGSKQSERKNNGGGINTFYGRSLQRRSHNVSDCLKANLFKSNRKGMTAESTNGSKKNAKTKTMETNPKTLPVVPPLPPRKVTPDSKFDSSHKGTFEAALSKKRSRCARTIPKSPKFSVMSWQRKMLFDDSKDSVQLFKSKSNRNLDWVF